MKLFILYFSIISDFNPARTASSSSSPPSLVNISETITDPKTIALFQNVGFPSPSFRNSNLPGHRGPNHWNNDVFAPFNIANISSISRVSSTKANSLINIARGYAKAYRPNPAIPKVERLYDGIVTRLDNCPQVPAWGMEFDARQGAKGPS